MSMTEEEIIKEILAVVTHEGDRDSFTTTELSDAIGLSNPTVRKKLRVLWNAGRLEATQKRITGIDGRSEAPSIITQRLADALGIEIDSSRSERNPNKTITCLDNR